MKIVRTVSEAELTAVATKLAKQLFPANCEVVIRSDYAQILLDVKYPSTSAYLFTCTLTLAFNNYNSSPNCWTLSEAGDTVLFSTINNADSARSVFAFVDKWDNFTKDFWNKFCPEITPDPERDEDDN